MYTVVCPASSAITKSSTCLRSGPFPSKGADAFGLSKERAASPRFVPCSDSLTPVAPSAKLDSYVAHPESEVRYGSAPGLALGDSHQHVLPNVSGNRPGAAQRTHPE